MNPTLSTSISYFFIAKKRYSRASYKVLLTGLLLLNNSFLARALDVMSDPFRAKYTKKLGKIGLFTVVVFSALSLGLGVLTMIPLVVVFIAIGIFFGVMYSVPPFRLRQTICKPLANFAVGAVPVLIVAAFSAVFSVSVVTLVLLIGITTAVNSLWEDLADYSSDFTNGASARASQRFRNCCPHPNSKFDAQQLPEARPPSTSLSLSIFVSAGVANCARMSCRIQDSDFAFGTSESIVAFFSKLND